MPRRQGTERHQDCVYQFMFGGAIMECCNKGLYGTGGSASGIASTSGSIYTGGAKSS